MFCRLYLFPCCRQQASAFSTTGPSQIHFPRHCMAPAALQAYDALPQGGALVAVDMLLDDERRAAVEALARSLTMLVEFGRENAGEYTFQVTS
jgi:hypothetical protein